MKNREKNIFTIIICVAAIFAVLVIKATGKDDIKENKIPVENQVTKVPTVSPALSPVITKDIQDDSMDQEEANQEDDTETTGGDYLPEDMVATTVYFNSEAYKLFADLPLDATKNLYSKLSKYIDKYIHGDKPVGSAIGEEGQMTLIEDTFVVDKEKNTCSFTSDLNNGYLLYVVIDLSNGKYTITDNNGQNN